MIDIIHVDLFINGQWRKAAAGEMFEIVNPATEEVVATAWQAGRADTEMAIAAARQGLAVWRGVPPWERSAVLRKAARLLEERGADIARRVVLDCGKPITQSLGEVKSAGEIIDWFADEARRISGQVLAGRSMHSRLHTLYEPVGVAAGFTAFNFPLVLPSRKIAAALAAGCSIICRPAEEGSACAAELVRCFIDAGLPAGVINLLTGRPEEIADTILASPVVRKISFTGSVAVGQQLIRRAADTVKRVTMELGGHAPVIVHADADPVKVAAGAVVAKFRNNGQVCVSPTRFFVHRSLEERFTSALVTASARLKIGNGIDPAVDIGPLINRRRLQAMEQMVEKTVEEGGIVVSGGRRPAGMEKGYFFEPTIISNVRDDMTVMQHEPFGPLALITGFATLEEVVERANAVDYGLASYVFTSSLQLAHQTVSALQAGIVTVNGWSGSLAEMPFGGVKYSGYGREGGSLGIFEYLDVKFFNLNFD
ncbi:MAG: NAD-dependent succinate-semialdehyde dehydrogenase [Thermodesulfobacteriota bacterium]